MQYLDPVFVVPVAARKAVNIEIQVERVDLRKAISPSRAVKPVECQIRAFVEQSFHNHWGGFDRIRARDRVISISDNGEGNLASTAGGVQQSDVVNS